MSVPATSERVKHTAGQRPREGRRETPSEGVIQPGVRRVLVYRLGSLGDTLVALPSLHLVARSFPNAERRMLTNLPVAARAPAAAAVLGDSGLIHSYERYPVGLRRPLQVLKTLLRLRRFAPEVAVYLKVAGNYRAARRDALFLKLTGARRIIGLPRSAWECEQRPVLPDGTLEPEAYRLARTLHALGDAQVRTRAAWDLCLNDSEKLRAHVSTQPLAGRPYFAVSVGTKVQAKDWGVGNWRAFLHELALAYPDHGLLLAGAAQEAGVTDTAAQGWRNVPGAGPAINLCGQLSPRETAAAFCGAQMFIGHDSGPMHLAAVVGTPTVAVFAARNRPRTWFPVSAPHQVVYHAVDCWGCGLETCVEQRKKCILSVTVQEVIAAVHASMQTIARGQTLARGISALPTQILSVEPMHVA